MTTSRHKNWETFVLPKRPPDGVFLGFTADDTSRICRAIQSATDGPWGHVFLGFEWEWADHPDGRVLACYYEALFSDGVTGPWPIKRVLDWHQETRHHRLAMVYIPTILSPDRRLDIALRCAESAVGKQSYFAWQLAAMLVFERYGIPVPRSDNRTVCSEFVAWALDGVIELRDRRRRRFDEVNPNSAWRRACEEVAGQGQYNRPPPEKPSSRAMSFQSEYQQDQEWAQPGIGASL